MIGRLFLSVALCLSATGACAQTAAVRDAPAGVPLYELRITNAGTRSQGVRGVLFNASGHEIAEDGAGQMVDTPIGQFRYVPCRMLWSVCGYFRDGVPAVPSAGPVDMDMPQILAWRLALAGNGAEMRWMAHLIDDDGDAVAAAPSGQSTQTPLGIFLTTSVPLNGVGGEGPLPEEWLAPAAR